MKAIPVLILFTLTTGVGQAQALISDTELLAGQSFVAETEFSHYQRTSNNTDPMSARQHHWFARYNPVSLALKGALLGYQRLMSQQLARSCPYEITCSNFSKQAIYQFGTLKGVFLSADRIMRCNRIGLLDVHPLSIDPQTGAIIDSPSQYRTR